MFASLDQMLYDDYLYLVASNKQQISCEKFKESTGKLEIVRYHTSNF